MPRPATERDIFQTIRDYIHVSAVLAGVKMAPQDVESIMFSLIQQLDPFHIAFPDEDKDFYPYLAQLAYATVTAHAPGGSGHQSSSLK